MGQYSSELNCIPLPASKPTTCLSYQGHVTESPPKEGEAIAGAGMCEAHMDELLQGRCADSAELTAIHTTCDDSYAEVLRDGCGTWARSTPHMTTIDKNTMARECVALLEELLIKPEGARERAEAATEAERRSCVQCGFECTGEALPEGGETGVGEAVTPAPGVFQRILGFFR